MGRIAVTEDIEGIRDEEDVDGKSEVEPDKQKQVTDGIEEISAESPSFIFNPKRKFVATTAEVQDAFESINTLRYSQPTHLQGYLFHLFLIFSHFNRY